LAEREKEAKKRNMTSAESDGRSALMRSRGNPQHNPPPPPRKKNPPPPPNKQPNPKKKTTPTQERKDVSTVVKKDGKTCSTNHCERGGERTERFEIATRRNGRICGARGRSSSQFAQ